MSEKKNDGGPAFPFHTCVHECNCQSGMTLRDYFAANCMSGLLGSNHFRYEPSEAESYATWAFDMADAMIAERNKP